MRVTSGLCATGVVEEKKLDDTSSSEAARGPVATLRRYNGYAVPLLAGPSAMATVLLLASRQIWRPLSNSPLAIETDFQSVWEAPVFPVAPIFQAWMKPFENLGMTTLTIRNTGGTDHQAFDAIGLPGWQFIQDPLDYGTRSHHTNWDVYERTIPADLMKNAVIIASFVYHTANRDQLLPRKPMPSAPR